MNGVDDIVEKINQEIEYMDDYYRSNEDNPVAEYVASFGYGGELLYEVEDRLRTMSSDDRYCFMSEDQIEFIEDLIALNRPNSLKVDVLQSFTTLRFIPDFYRRDDELVSMNCGEVECIISDEVINQIEGLTEDERKEIENRCDAHVNLSMFAFYLDLNYCRWAMIVDIDRLDQVMATWPVDKKCDGSNVIELRRL